MSHNDAETERLITGFRATLHLRTGSRINGIDVVRRSRMAQCARVVIGADTISPRWHGRQVTPRRAVPVGGPDRVRPCASGRQSKLPRQTKEIRPAENP